MTYAYLGRDIKCNDNKSATPESMPPTNNKHAKLKA